MNYEEDIRLPKILRDIQPGMFSSEQIWQYIDKNWLIETYSDDERQYILRECLGPATYEMRLGKDAAKYIGNERKRFYLAETPNYEKGEISELVLEPNSLTFVSTYEKFKLPNNIIARFNLKVKYVHKGLLLGTGPIVDPGYNSILMIPIHNFSNSPVIIRYKERFISVEFTKLLSIDGSHYVENQNKTGSFDEYLDKAGIVNSSIGWGISQSLHKVDSIEKEFTNFKQIGIVGLITVGLAIAGITSSFYLGLQSRIDGLQNLFTSYAQKQAISDSQLNILNEKINELKNDTSVPSEPLFPRHKDINLPIDKSIR